MHRWWSRWFLALVLCVPVAWVASAWAEEAESGTAAEEKVEVEGKAGDQPARKEISDGEKARFQENLAELEQRLQKLQMEELKLAVRLLKAQGAARKLVAEPWKVPEQLAAGDTAPELLEYKRIMLACAAQLQKMGGEYARLYRSAEPLGRQRDRMPEELNARADAVLARVRTRRRINLDKRAGFYLQAAEPKQALRVYRLIYKEAPQDIANLNNMVNVYITMRDYKQALTVYTDIYRQLPEDVENLQNMAAMYEKLGDYKRALEKYKEILELYPQHVESLLNVGRMYAQRGAYKQAVAAYDQVTEQVSHDLGWVRRMAGLYESVGAWQKALILYEKVYRELPAAEQEKDADLKAAIKRLRRKLTGR
ncbi:MAG: tetratricopeptide repeat protein [Phycisphaerae bacterium]